MTLPEIIQFVIDLLAVLLLALGIKGLSKVKSARDANRLAAFAMSLSVVGLISYYIGTSGIAIQSWIWIIIGSIIGSLFGAILAKKVPSKRTQRILIKDIILKPQFSKTLF